MRRVILMVTDSVGVGALPDAASYGDMGANTFAHAAAYARLCGAKPEKNGLWQY